VWQKEQGEGEKTLHFQGYVMFHNPKTMKQLKAMNSRAHWESRKGTHKQAVVRKSGFGAYAPKIEQKLR